MSPRTRIAASMAFSISVTLILMFAVSRFPGLEIPLAYWIFGTLCPGVISFTVTLQLVRQTERIRELQRQRENFLQLLSHDMRAPQASIIALLESPSGHCDPGLAERIRAYASRTLAMADSMVQLSRAQMLQFRPEELNIVDIGLDAVDALTPQARAKHIRLEERFEDDEILIAGEPSLLARAFINLIDNAVKFSPESSVIRLSIARALHDKRDAVVCTVSDSGIGIAPDRLAGLYTAFEGARPNPAGTTPGTPRGTGLGLAFVKTVVTRHGGAIHCESAEGRGTTFRIVLPVVAGAT